MIKTYIESTHDGYILMAHITYHDERYGERLTLMNFGEYRSAAVEMRDFLNDNDLEANQLERLVRLWAKCYDPKRLYSYPEIKDRKCVTLNIQREWK